MGTIQGALFLFVFRYILGGAIDPRSDFDYVDFLVPGFLATAILWGADERAPGIAEDAASGVHDRFRSLPIPRLAVVAGRSLADTALTSWNLIITAVVGFAFGFRAHGGPADFLPLSRCCSWRPTRSRPTPNRRRPRPSSSCR
jgi:hypothetical protein